MTAGRPRPGAGPGQARTETDVAAVLYGPEDLRTERLPREPLGDGQVRVQVRGVGVCGSDVHYYAHGRNGTNVVGASAVLGHEGFGVITEVGPGVPGGRIGNRVAVEPASPCGQCPVCRAGRYNVCPSGTCLGSPPTGGLLRTHVVVAGDFAHDLPGTIPDAVAPLIEPLAVACWACRRARVNAGHRVLVTGAGPIGLLTAAVLRAGGADVVISEAEGARLEIAARMGVGRVVSSRDPLPERAFDRLVECSGAPAALAAISALRPGGVAALVGTPAAEAPVPLGWLHRWEIDLVPCFRYGPGGFAAAITLAAQGTVPLHQFVTARYPLGDAAAALRIAMADRRQLKVVVEPQTGALPEPPDPAAQIACR
jgi:L-iditol 2-dehydrogenase